jgi:hypothetical protein
MIRDRPTGPPRQRGLDVRGRASPAYAPDVVADGLRLDLKDSGRGNSSRSVGLTRGLVVFQMRSPAFSRLGPPVRSIVNQQTVDYGYDTSGICPRAGLMDGDYPAARKIFFDHLLVAQRFNAFESVALTSRFQMVFSAEYEIEEDVQHQGRSPERELRAGLAGLLQCPRSEDARGPRLRRADLDTKQPVAVINAELRDVTSGGRVDRAKVPNRRRQRPQFGPGAPSGVVSTVRMSPPFNNRNVEDSGFYALYSVAFVPRRPSPSQPPTVIVKPRAGQSAALSCLIPPRLQGRS